MLIVGPLELKNSESRCTLSDVGDLPALESPMYLLRYLQSTRSKEEHPLADKIAVEYRLACSGELLNRMIGTAEWRKSDLARVLVQAPFEMFVSSRPFDAYPQELCVRMTIARMTERDDTGGIPFVRDFLPDEDIVEDLCSILTLLSRRLISPIGKIRERRFREHPVLGSFGSDMPVPVVSISRVAVWNQRPVSIVTNRDGQQLIEYAPPPVGVNHDALKEFLLKLPDIQGATKIVSASRSYRTALEVIESRPDISYQLLISAVETLASVALPDFKPQESEQLATRSSLLKLARKLGINEDNAKRLALETCRDNPWSRRKFKKFLTDNVSPRKLAVKDQLFLVPESLCPEPQHFAKALDRVYSVRSGNLHEGSPFPPFVGIGTSPSIKSKEMRLSPLQPGELPPVAWFERVAFMAAQTLLLGLTSVASPPFAEGEVGELWK